MNVAELLRSIQLGSDVAESDSGLSSYFFHTTAFDEMVDDEVDILLGPKGSGKTAIFRMLSEQGAELEPISDVDVIPAFNTQGAVVFGQTPNEHLTDPRLMRRVWIVYLLATVGNYLCDKYDQSWDSVRDLQTRLESLGLRARAATIRATWDAIVAKVGPEENGAPTPPDAFGSPLPETMDFQEHGQLTLPPQLSDSRSWTHNAFDPEELIRLEHAVLQTAGRRCWLVLDRLDEAFQDHPDHEVSLLRSLLRAHSDVCSFGRTLRVKVFLRTDIYSRVTQDQGFLNLDHLRAMTIKWTSDALANVIANRLKSNQTFREAFAATLEQLPTDLTPIDLQKGKKHSSPSAQILYLYIPRHVFVYTSNRKHDRRSGFRWCLDQVVDSSLEPAPRNVLSLFREARRHKLSNQLAQLVAVKEGEPLLSHEDLNAAWRTVSDIRLVDTLYAESSELRPFIERFRQWSVTSNVDAVAALFGLDTSSTEWVISHLERAGLLIRNSPSTVRIAALYVPALQASNQTASLARAGTVAARLGPVSSKLYGRNLEGAQPLPVAQAAVVANTITTTTTTTVTPAGESDTVNAEHRFDYLYRLLKSYANPKMSASDPAALNPIIVAAKAKAREGKPSEAVDLLRRPGPLHLGTAHTLLAIANGSEDPELCQRVLGEVVKIDDADHYAELLGRAVVTASISAKLLTPYLGQVLNLTSTQLESTLPAMLAALDSQPRYENRFWREVMIALAPRATFYPRAAQVLDVVAASRFLTTLSSIEEQERSAPLTLGRSLASAWWPNLEKSKTIPVFEGVLYAYARSPSSTSPHLQPEDVVSIAELLSILGRPPQPRKAAIPSLLAELGQASPATYAEIRKWGEGGAAW